ncbi:MAG: hypothetical protein BAJATHORv1_20490 [Candidatus Thorarchaeota archaeon]|nr:MAG: hypothetical protein BAJATHORv1_20490 [Candidatus Thorarchaeota archaeon]
MRAKISLSFFSPDDAKIAHASISPDNAPLPSDIELRTKVNECDIVLVVSTSKGIQRLMATLEDLLSSIDLSLRVTESIIE